ncbi:MAG: hypothetical protein EHM67_04325 [Hyphomicrobiaceae bacterium]|nr:MAG: hypothetical protein EHM67_04325 [Hyphomicrobiaceae bacterium]
MAAPADSPGTADGQTAGRRRAADGDGHRCRGLQAPAEGNHGTPRQSAFAVVDPLPTLVLVGREDALTPPALAQEIAGGIAGSRLEIIADCGHLSTLERPEPVNQALRTWLSG